MVVGPVMEVVDDTCAVVADIPWLDVVLVVGVLVVLVRESTTAVVDTVDELVSTLR